MDHSLRGYLGRRTTEELYYTLDTYLEGAVTDLHRDIITIILDILHKRKATPPAELPPEFKRYWDHLNDR